MPHVLATRLAIAALVGLAVGIEREWSGHGAAGPHPRFAGVRTFLLIGGLGGIAGWLAEWGQPVLAGALVVGAAGLVAAAYWSAARAGGEALDGTTEVAALVVIALGLLAGMGQLAVAGGAGALVVLALREKDTIRALVARLDATELRAALQFSVLALVVLPVLPARDLGPLGGVNPRNLWIVVLLFSGLNFTGFIARRLVGASRGFGVTGALGGTISSTAVALQFSRLSAVRPDLAEALAVGTVAASTVLLPRLLVVSWALAPAVAQALLPFLALPFATGLVLVALRARRPDAQAGHGTARAPERNPLGLASAVRMALAFQATLMAIAFVRARFGTSGVLLSAGLLGLTDMDALTLSMNRMGRETGAVALAAHAIVVGIATNTALKAAIVAGLGRGAFRAQALRALLALLAATLAGLAVYFL